jgi:hypothetical protein
MALNEALKEFSIEGKAALVIGAELPLGAAAAQALAEAGANLVLASQDPGTGDQLKELAKKISAMGRKAVVQVQSAISRADLSACMDLTVKQLGALDILVNALDVPFFAPVEGTDDSAFERVIENNLKTFWVACQEAGRTMIQRGGGVIVNLTSIMAERGVPNASLYGAAQAAVLNPRAGAGMGAQERAGQCDRDGLGGRPQESRRQRRGIRKNPGQVPARAAAAQTRRTGRRAALPGQPRRGLRDRAVNRDRRRSALPRLAVRCIELRCASWYSTAAAHR